MARSSHLFLKEGDFTACVLELMQSAYISSRFTGFRYIFRVCTPCFSLPWVPSACSSSRVHSRKQSFAKSPLAPCFPRLSALYLPTETRALFRCFSRLSSLFFASEPSNGMRLRFWPSHSFLFLHIPRYSGSFPCPYADRCSGY